MEHKQLSQAKHTSVNRSSQVQTAEKLRPTKKQKELLGYIEGFIAEHGYSPSYREIMNGLEYTSVATVALHVGNLIKRGHLRKRDHSARSLEVVATETSAASDINNLKTNEVKPSDEKWLVAKVEDHLAALEDDPYGAVSLDDLAILLAALRILGLEGAALSFQKRYAALKKRVSERQG